MIFSIYSIYITSFDSVSNFILLNKFACRTRARDGYALSDVPIVQPCLAFQTFMKVKETTDFPLVSAFNRVAYSRGKLCMIHCSKMLMILPL